MAKPIKVNKKIREKIEEIIECQIKGTIEEVKAYLIRDQLLDMAEKPLFWKVKFDEKKEKIKLDKVYYLYDLSQKELMEEREKTVREWHKLEDVIRRKLKKVNQ